MAKKLEVIIKESIDVNRIAKAIRAEGYRTKTDKGNKAVVLSGGFLDKLRSPDRFQKLEDGWIKDSLLGLEWGPSSDTRMNWAAAKQYAVDKGGRLPTVDELASLVDRSKQNPAIDSIFADTKTDDYYWTITAYAGSSGLAWCVYFGFGSVHCCGKDFYNYVRPVRSSQ
jgi:hypothetical protein